MKMFLATLAVLGFTSVTQAQGLKAKKAQTADADAEKSDLADMTKSCGCAPKFTYDWKGFSTDEDYLIPGRARSSVKSALEDLCKDAEGKKAVCAKVKEVSVKKGAPLDPVFTGSKLTIQRNASESSGDIHNVLENAL